MVIIEKRREERKKIEKWQVREKLRKPVTFGGDKRDRTADLLNAIQALSQLSYTPMSKMYIIRHAAKCQEFFSRI